MKTRQATKVQPFCNQRAQRAPISPQSKAPMERVELGTRPASQSPMKRSHFTWAAAGFTAVAAMGSAAGALAQAAPPTSVAISVEKPNPGQVLTRSQLDLLRSVRAPKNANSRAQRLFGTYTPIAERVLDAHGTFTRELPDLMELGNSIEQMRVNMGGRMISVRTFPDGRKEVQIIQGRINKKLSMSQTSLTFEAGGLRSTLHLRSYGSYRAGDFVVDNGREVVTTSNDRGVLLRRESGETYYVPQQGEPTPVLYYHSPSKNLEVAVKPDGGTSTTQFGRTIEEPPG